MLCYIVANGEVHCFAHTSSYVFSEYDTHKSDLFKIVQLPVNSFMQDVQPIKLNLKERFLNAAETLSIYYFISIFGVESKFSPTLTLPLEKKAQLKPQALERSMGGTYNFFARKNYPGPNPPPPQKGIILYISR